MPSHPSSAAFPTSSRKRENASFLVQRMRAQPVALFPPSLSESLQHAKNPSAHRHTLPSVSSATSAPTEQKSGLGRQDVLVVGNDMNSGRYTHRTTQWLHHVAAQHALKGGRVVYVYPPGSGVLRPNELVECVEKLSTDGGSGCGEAVSCEASMFDATCQDINSLQERIEKKKEVVLAAMDRVDVVHCRDVNDLYVFCACYTWDTSSPLETCTGTGSPQPSAPCVPLVIIRGIAGRDSYICHYERAIGQEVPLQHWIFCLLQSRLGCALILEEVNGVPPTAALAAGNASLMHQRVGGRVGSDIGHPPVRAPFLLSQQSDVLRWLQVSHVPSGERAAQGAGEGLPTTTHRKRLRGGEMEDDLVQHADMSTYQFFYIFHVLALQQPSLVAETARWNSSGEDVNAAMTMTSTALLLSIHSLYCGIGSAHGSCSRPSAPHSTFEGEVLCVVTLP